MIEHIAKKQIEEGLCPMCGEELDYGNCDTQDGYRWYNVGCAACDWKGRQWDKVTFTGYTVTDSDTGDVYNVEPADTCNPAGGEIESVLLAQLTSDKVIEKLITALDDMTDRVEQEHNLDHEQGYVEGEPGDDCLTCCDIKEATRLANDARTFSPPPIIIEVQGGLVQNVVKLDQSIKVIIRDYDVEGVDEDDPHIAKDAQGRLCCESEW